MGIPILIIHQQEKIHQKWLGLFTTIVRKEKTLYVS